TDRVDGTTRSSRGSSCSLGLWLGLRAGLRAGRGRRGGFHLGEGFIWELLLAGSNTGVSRGEPERRKSRPQDHERARLRVLDGKKGWVGEHHRPPEPGGGALPVKPRTLSRKPEIGSTPKSASLPGVEGPRREQLPGRWAAVCQGIARQRG